MTASAVMPSMSLSRGRAVVTSLAVAEHFHKLHKNVLRDIERLLPDLPEEFRRPNFRPMFREVVVGNGAVRKEPVYELTRDGFTLLAMGFTGQKALAWKVRYIEAFNFMEAEILRLRQEAPPRRITPADVRAVMEEQMARLGRASVEPDHPLAGAWTREAHEYLRAAAGMPPRLVN